MIPHEYQRSFVKCLGVLKTENGTNFGTVLVMGPFSELALNVVPLKLEQYAARFSLKLPENLIPYIFYIGDDDIPVHFQLTIPNGQTALVANISRTCGDVFFTPFLMRYIRWLCEVRNDIIEYGGFSDEARDEWREFRDDFLAECPVYALYVASQEEMNSDIQSIYNSLVDSGILTENPFDPYEYNGVSPSDFY